MQKITPFLWFDKEAEQAAKFFTSVFKSVFKGTKSRVLSVARYTKEPAAASGQPKGSAMVVSFELRGQRFDALNGGKPDNFDTRFTGAISFVVNCKTQKEIDDLWKKLPSDGGATNQCGWLMDRYGVSWQIVPEALEKYAGGKDRAGARRTMATLMEMTRIDIEGLKMAYLGKLDNNHIP